MQLLDQSVAEWAESPFASLRLPPWSIVKQAEQLIRAAVSTLGQGYRVEDGLALHETAIIEQGVILKGAGIIGPRCFIAAGAYLRGGVYLGADCIVGPGSELKTTFLFSGSKLAHLNFVGDSLIGSQVNIEAGAVVANYRNELADKTIRILHGGEIIDTGVEKFGSLIGDGVRVGANAVIAPGAVLAPGEHVPRLSLVDQYPY